MITIADALVATALTKLGVKESGGNNKGKALQPFFDADSYDPNGGAAGDDGYAWCASFVCWVFLVVLAGRKITFKRPTTASAFGFIDWSLAQDASTNTMMNPSTWDIKKGDLVIFKFSHIGIALADAADGKVQTIDGNTNAAGSREGNAVAKKTRLVSQVKARIRIRG
jgi:hypothetical protein